MSAFAGKASFLGLLTTSETFSVTYLLLLFLGLLLLSIYDAFGLWI